MSITTKLVALLVMLLVISVGGVLMLWRWSPPTPGTFSLEVAKALVQLGTVSVVGAIISLLTNELQHRRASDDRERERRRADEALAREREQRLAENRDEFLRSLLARITEGYATAKRSRRLLRARALTAPYHTIANGTPRVRLAAYDAELATLNDVQLDLETVLKEIETSPGAFSQQQAMLDALRLMEKYLSQLVREYEKHQSQFAGDPPTLAMSMLPRLTDFVGSSDGSEFLSRFASGYRRVLEVLRGELLQPSSASGRLQALRMSETSHSAAAV